ncbi:MAG: TetR family transcriptional regulator [Dermatophilaceae bacterium]
MRIAGDSAQRLDSDLTARARIRDAAIECFVAEGFDASFRTIAARADVSPGLITHHFRSKAALREACDEEVLRRYFAMKSAGVAEPTLTMVANLTNPALSGALAVYLLRAVLAGGAMARHFLERLMDETRQVMAESLAAGLVRPSRDEEARVRYLTYQAIGALVVQFVTTPGVTPEEFLTSLRSSQADFFLPLLELYTEGLLTGPQLLEDYLRLQREPVPAVPADAQSPTG